MADSSSGTVFIAPTSLEDAAQQLNNLYQSNDAHAMYTSTFAKSRSDTADEMGAIEDQYNGLKTLMGKLIDGSRKELHTINSEFAYQDKNMADALSVTQSGQGGASN